MFLHLFTTTLVTSLLSTSSNFPHRAQCIHSRFRLTRDPNTNKRIYWSKQRKIPDNCEFPHHPAWPFDTTYHRRSFHVPGLPFRAFRKKPHKSRSKPYSQRASPFKTLRYYHNSSETQAIPED